MTDGALTRLEHGLAALKADHLARRRPLLDGAQGAHVTIDGRRVVSFCSNDYLGLANDPALVAAAHAALDGCGVGAGAAHLISGHHRLHLEFETDFAQWVGKPAALLFSTGYLANLAVVTALISRRGEVFADKLNHASLVDAAKLSGARFSRYRHGDLAQLESRLAASTARDRMIVSDLVFSMDGDVAPVDALLDLAERYDAWLYLDDAHGFGVLNGGRGGLSERARASTRVIYLATLGKAAGVAGASVAADGRVIEWLIQTARPYIYTTAAPPLLAAALRESLRQIAAGAARRGRLQRHVARLRSGLGGLKNAVLADSFTPIQPLIVGANADALTLSQALLQRGILVPAIRTPTVPANTARLRITLSAAHSDADVARLVETVHELA
ncbi:8-amino-7-oxononanoate synthase [Thiobacillus denitrificans ATCC 25259]|uniref:8-amino-7-oxononanoate synthase n=1 Tax=Thiobacillus denitrificans (strain ATCC 25259 / T1) TaxID=292415 RepID=BIOF_THIDA|nr:8-amino-7-oxononanoate synthase [Thiobacillus denitrificans]Q3SLX9.1 RecName: Full=8-amino-7-oxononanoate synthase; Short=AONS; AltName: Full=7-keto-8-amino-pelargonic acid synthase; Short=7-KAP synthase; Short=KAPA synthase; AltName: Full=8-amino-7-ketopelargonate synthase [Thiobacillus denitrificans ATCC 25259]AAZ96273.1 8-amino-7-oxononanoate synthase [Thiobacillus denitrificans ATCC 25259]